jgi:undecaprenyl-diphosphatase
MDFILLLKSLIMGIVEGITEFLPISSTGHLIVTGELLNFLPKEQSDIYEIFIQLGAMCAVFLEYRKKLFTVACKAIHPGAERTLLLGVFLAFLPAAFLGLIFGHAIKEHLFNPTSVAYALIIGGFVIFWAEKKSHSVRVESVDDISLKDAFLVGLAQCFALIPGTSRSGATIIGGMFCGLSRKAATEFSFFLGLPTLGAASLYSLYKAQHILTLDDLGIWAIGFFAAFISAFITIRALLKFISTHSFLVFAWYRVIFGLLVLWLFA